MNKNDKRYLQTELLIRQSYIKLTKDKPKHMITVSEICNDAKINRGSFYLHYKDVYDLHSTLEDESISFITNIFNQYSFDGNFFQLVDLLFDEFLKEPLHIDFLLNLSTTAKNTLTQNTKKVTIEQWEQHSSLTDLQASIAYDYLVGGMISVLKNWMDHHFQDTEKYKDLFFVLATKGLHHYLYQKC